METKIPSKRSALSSTSSTPKSDSTPTSAPSSNAIVGDWPHHLATLKDFWSTVLLTTGRYKGDPMMTHLQLPLDPDHFERWLTLFAETATEALSPDCAATVITKSQRIAQNFKAGIAFQQSKTAAQCTL